MKTKLFLLYYEYGVATPKLIELEIIKETEKQYKLGSNPLYMAILNKSAMTDDTCYISSTFRKHIIIRGEENLEKGFNKLINGTAKELGDAHNLVKSLQEKLDNLRAYKEKVLGGK